MPAGAWVRECGYPLATAPPRSIKNANAILDAQRLLLSLLQPPGPRLEVLGQAVNPDAFLSELRFLVRLMISYGQPSDLDSPLREPKILEALVPVTGMGALNRAITEPLVVATATVHALEILLAPSLDAAGERVSWLAERIVKTRPRGLARTSFYRTKGGLILRTGAARTGSADATRLREADAA